MAGQITGYVTTANGRLLEGCSVAAKSSSKTLTTQSVPLGGFLIENVPDGTYVMTATKTGYTQDGNVTATVANGGTTSNIVITLKLE